MTIETPEAAVERLDSSVQMQIGKFMERAKGNLKEGFEFGFDGKKLKFLQVRSVHTEVSGGFISPKAEVINVERFLPVVSLMEGEMAVCDVILMPDGQWAELNYEARNWEVKAGGMPRGAREGLQFEFIPGLREPQLAMDCDYRVGRGVIYRLGIKSITGSGNDINELMKIEGYLSQAI